MSGGAMASPARCENSTYAPSTDARTAAGTTSSITADNGPLYHVYKKKVANSRGTKRRSSSTSNSPTHTGPPSTKPAPETSTRPPLQCSSSQSPTFPPNSAPSVPPARPQIPNARPTATTGSPWVRSRKLGAHAMRPFTAKVTSAPPRKIQTSVGVRSTVAAAWTKSSNAVAATSLASVVRRTAIGTRRITVHTIPVLTATANTAVSRFGGTPWNRSSTLLARAPSTVNTTRGAATLAAGRTPRSSQRRTVATRGAGGRRAGSRSREASTARTRPGAPMATNAARQP